MWHPLEYKQARPMESTAHTHTHLHTLYTCDAHRDVSQDTHLAWALLRPRLHTDITEENHMIHTRTDAFIIKIYTQQQKSGEQTSDFEDISWS